MRSRGTITRWDDERGFGFIARPDSNQHVFLHVTALPSGARRPEAGDSVTFDLVRGEEGKPRAENVRLAGRRGRARRPARRERRGNVGVAVALLLLSGVVIATLFQRLPTLLPGWYVAISLLTFLVYGLDKSAARRGHWRTPESSLHALSLLGGWPGALAAQRLLRHKSSKRSFQSVFWFTVAVNMAALGYLGLSGDDAAVLETVENFFEGVFRQSGQLRW